MAGISPEPEIRKPLRPGVAEAVQVKVDPGTLDCSTTGVLVDPEQMSWVIIGLVTVDCGFTVTTRFDGVPVHSEVAGPVGVIV